MCIWSMHRKKTNGYIWPLGYKLRGISAMAKVEHLGDFVSMLESAWEPCSSHMLDSLHPIV
jgi:hypothetical protein